MLKSVANNKAKKVMKTGFPLEEKNIAVLKEHIDKLLNKGKAKKEPQYYSGRDYFERSVREQKAAMREHMRIVKAYPFNTLSASCYLRCPEEEKLEAEVDFIGGNLPTKTLYKGYIQSFKGLLEYSLFYSNLRSPFYNPEVDDLNNPPKFKQILPNLDFDLGELELGGLLEKEHNINVLDVTKWDLSKEGNYFGALKVFPFIAFQLIREYSFRTLYMDLISTRDADVKSCDRTVELVREYEEYIYSQTGKNLYDHFGDKKSVIIPLTDDQNNIDWEAIKSGKLNLNQTVDNSDFFYSRFAKIVFPKVTIETEIGKLIGDEKINQFIHYVLNYGNYLKGEFKYLEIVGLPKFDSKLAKPALIKDLKSNKDLIENLAKIHHYVYALAKELNDYFIHNKALIIQNKDLMVKELLFMQAPYLYYAYDKSSFLKNGLLTEYKKMVRYEKMRLGNKGLKTGRDTIYIEYPFEWFVYTFETTFKGDKTYREHILSFPDNPIKDATLKIIDKVVEKELSKR